MTAYQRGTAREREWAERLEAQGWVVTRAAGSRGDFDLMACRHGDIQLWECKSNKAGPFSDFGPAKREALTQAATAAGGTPFLVWWPYDRQGPRILPGQEWPD